MPSSWPICSRSPPPSTGANNAACGANFYPREPAPLALAREGPGSPTLAPVASGPPSGHPPMPTTQPLPDSLANRWRPLLCEQPSAAGVHANVCRARGYRTITYGDQPGTAVRRAAGPVTTTHSQQTSAGARPPILRPGARRELWTSPPLALLACGLPARGSTPTPKPPRAANTLALTQRQPSVAPQVAFPKRVGLIVVVFAFRPPRGP